jgi:hypothetical protein
MDSDLPTQGMDMRATSRLSIVDLPGAFTDMVHAARPQLAAMGLQIGDMPTAERLESCTFRIFTVERRCTMRTHQTSTG